jgi:very-short-patch-repair endonuclease
VLLGRQAVSEVRRRAMCRAHRLPGFGGRRRLRLVIEADGAAWHDDKITREDDAEKTAILEAHGYRVLRITWDQAVHHPQQALARIRAALAAAVRTAR